MGAVFNTLYPVVFFITMLGYIPQIVKLIRYPISAHGVSRTTWCLWLVSSSISLGYGVFVLRDTMFSLVSLTNVVAIMIVIALVVRARMGLRVLPVNVPVDVPPVGV